MTAPDVIMWLTVMHILRMEVINTGKSLTPVNDSLMTR